MMSLAWRPIFRKLRFQMIADSQREAGRLARLATASNKSGLDVFRESLTPPLARAPTVIGHGPLVTSRSQGCCDSRVSMALRQAGEKFAEFLPLPGFEIGNPKDFCPHRLNQRCSRAQAHDRRVENV